MNDRAAARLATLLPPPNIDGGRAQIGRLQDARRGIPDEQPGAVQPIQEGRSREMADRLNGRGLGVAPASHFLKGLANPGMAAICVGKNDHRPQFRRERLL